VDKAQIHILRVAQDDLTISFTQNLLGKTDYQDLTKTLAQIASSSTRRTYEFPTQKDLLVFEAMLTGFTIMYDGSATNFSIARRRMVVSLHKKIETNLARLQVVQRGSVIQVVAFFNDFSLGRCMSFLVKGLDKFESFSKHEKHYVRFVDAKFALPKAEKENVWENDFLCLDTPEFASEHDDIVVGFDNEQGMCSFPVIGIELS
jgi:hypothetical protein